MLVPLVATNSEPRVESGPCQLGTAGVDLDWRKIDLLEPRKCSPSRTVKPSKLCTKHGFLFNSQP